MYRLLIVDDVPDIVDWLYEIFTEDVNFDLEIVKAYSGAEALEYLNTRKIDIVMSDIRMPGINGLQLLEEIKKNWPACRVIFLTGYNEFDYVYKAIQYEGVSYLLKTEDDEVILESLRKAIEELDSNLKHTNLLQDAKESIKSILPILKREFFMDLFSGDTRALVHMDEKIRKLELDLDIKDPVLLLVGSSKSYQPYKNSDVSLYEAVHTLLCRFFSPRLKLLNVGNDGQVFIWVIQPDKSEEQGCSQEKINWDKNYMLIKGALESSQLACFQSLDTSITFVLDTEPCLLETLSTRYSKTKNLLNDAICMQIDILSTDRTLGTINENSVMECSEKLDSSGQKLVRMDMLKNYFERGMKAEFFETLSFMLEGLKDVKSKHALPAVELYFSIALTFLSYINRKALVEKLSLKIGYYKLISLDMHDSWSDAVQYLYQMADVLFEHQESDMKKFTGDSIQRVKDYIEAHLNEDLSLDKLADLVYFNPSYLSRLFKQSTGEKLSDYISKARISKAKKLLMEKDKKIQDIALAVGFDSPRYFSHFFKSYTGDTPQNFRMSANEM